MKRVLFIVVFLLSAGFGFSQSNVYSSNFNYTGDTSHLNDVWNTPAVGSDGFGFTIELEDSSLLIYGASRRNNYGPIQEEQRELKFFFKYDKVGNLLDSVRVNLREDRWINFYDFIEVENGILAYGNYFDTAYNDWNLIYVKFDLNGDTVWTKSKKAQYEYPTSIVATEHNYYCMSMLSPPTSAGIHGNILYKFDLDFNLLDSVFYDWDVGYNYEYNVKFTMVNDTSLYLFNKHTFYNYVDYRTKFGLMKMDTFGAIKLHKYYSIDPNIINDMISSLVTKDNQNIYMCGTVQYETTDYHRNALLIKTDINGNLIWQKEFDVAEGTTEEAFYNITETYNGNLLISGFSAPGTELNAQRRPWLLKIDTSGEKIWERFLKYDSVLDKSCGLSLQKISNDGGIILTGSVFSGFDYGYAMNDLNDAWLLKTDSCGFTKGDIPEPSFIISSIQNYTITINNTSDNYCTASINYGNGDSTKFYAYSTPRPGQFTYTFADTGTYTIKLTALAGEEFRIYENTIKIYGDTTVGIEEIMLDQFEVNLYPNPAQDQVNIVFNENLVQKNTTIKTKVFNFSGTEVLAFDYNTNIQKQSLDVSKLSNGVYYMSFYNAENSHLGNKKFVVLR